MDKQFKFSVRLIEFEDGSTQMELTGHPTMSQVLGILEAHRAIQQLLAINAFTATRRKATAKKKRTHGLSK